MIVRTPTVDVVRSLSDLLEFTVGITSMTDNGDGTYTLGTCNTYHLQPGFTVTIGGEDYVIESVIRNEEIVVSGTVTIIDPTFVAYTPFYYHGTPIQVSRELTEINVASDKTPMVYLSEELKEKYFARDSAIDREVPCRIFFLTQCDFENWLTEDYHNQAINPMRELALEFVELCKRSKLIGKLTEFDINTMQRVGVSTSGGNKKNFANAHLSGVELLITLPINRENCIAPCPTFVVVPPSEGIIWEDMTEPWETYTGAWETYQ